MSCARVEFAAYGLLRNQRQMGTACVRVIHGESFADLTRLDVLDLLGNCCAKPITNRNVAIQRDTFGHKFPEKGGQTSYKLGKK